MIPDHLNGIAFLDPTHTRQKKRVLHQSHASRPFLLLVEVFFVLRAVIEPSYWWSSKSCLVKLPLWVALLRMRPVVLMNFCPRITPAGRACKTLDCSVKVLPQSFKVKYPSPSACSGRPAVSAAAGNCLSQIARIFSEMSKCSMRPCLRLPGGSCRPFGCGLCMLRLIWAAVPRSGLLVRSCCRFRLLDPWLDEGG